MSASNTLEIEKKRLRNQFSKEERSQLLAIMKEYSLLLDDKNLSILSRKEIWEAIEMKFNEGGHLARTSAQLKKYWQNYKYHNKRTRVIQRDNSKSMSPITKRVIQIMSQVDPEEWTQYGIVAGLAPFESSNASLKNQTALLKCRITKINNQDIPSNVVLSSSEIFENSVTVSLVCPENSENCKNNSENTMDPVTPSQSVISTLENNKNSKNSTELVERPKTLSISPDREKMTKIQNFRTDYNSSYEVVTNDSFDAFPKDLEKRKKEAKRSKFFEKFSSPQEVSTRRRVLQEVGEVVESIGVPEVDSEIGYKEQDLKKIRNFNPVKEVAMDSSSKDIMAKQLILKDLKSMKEPKNEETDRCVFKCQKKNHNEASTSPVIDVEIKETEECKEIKAEAVERRWKFNIEIDNKSQSLSSAGFRQDNQEKDNVKVESQNSIKHLGTTCELDHRLELQKLETEENRLKLKVSELAICEIRLRIQSLEEERNRERELHAFRLAEISKRTYLDSSQFTGNPLNSA